MKNEETSISKRSEEYLEAIYRLEKKTGSARTMELARQLNVTPGSVINTIESLERRRLIIHKPYKGVKLTEEGRKLALEVLRRHRLAERLLMDFLRLDWSQVHDAACKLEHAITEEIIKPLEKALKHPKTCPHGNPIPTACGGIIEEKSEPLLHLNPKEKAIIAKITKEESSTLKHLATLGLMPGAFIEVEHKSSYGGPITIKVGEVSHTLEHKLASIISVRRD
ncbi:metal-dependent transcriptional regulator [Candidatus Bathyarchaeota archaeon]|nr:metal-dependent transcriptional regulator [Candidatus Bathyarchaeota archaeon]